MTKSLFAAAAIAAVFAAGQAMAGPAQTAYLSTAKVDFRDPVQAHAFFSRIRDNAERVCRVHGDGAGPASDRECVARAVQDAVDQLGQREVTQTYQASLRTDRALAINDQ